MIESKLKKVWIFKRGKSTANNLLNATIISLYIINIDACVCNFIAKLKYLSNHSTKVQMLGAELAIHTVQRHLLRLTTIYLLLTLTGKCHQTTLSRGNFNKSTDSQNAQHCISYNMYT